MATYSTVFVGYRSFCKSKRNSQFNWPNFWVESSAILSCEPCQLKKTIHTLSCGGGGFPPDTASWIQTLESANTWSCHMEATTAEFNVSHTKDTSHTTDEFIVIPKTQRMRLTSFQSWNVVILLLPVSGVPILYTYIYRLYDSSCNIYIEIR